jgi:hypothetical protein
MSEEMDVGFISVNIDTFWVVLVNSITESFKYI